MAPSVGYNFSQTFRDADWFTCMSRKCQQSHRSLIGWKLDGGGVFLSHSFSLHIDLSKRWLVKKVQRSDFSVCHWSIFRCTYCVYYKLNRIRSNFSLMTFKLFRVVNVTIHKKNNRTPREVGKVPKNFTLVKGKHWRNDSSKSKIVFG